MMINLEKEIREQPQVLAGIKENNMAAIKKIVADIKAGQITNVYFAARGTSDHASIYAQYLIHRFLGIPCALATPSTITLYQSPMHLEHSLSSVYHSPVKLKTGLLSSKAEIRQKP